MKHHPMKVVFGVVAFSAAGGIIVPCVAGSSGRHDVSSLWHAMDGIPNLMDRRPARKMSVNKTTIPLLIPRGWMTGRGE